MNVAYNVAHYCKRKKPQVNTTLTYGSFLSTPKDCIVEPNHFLNFNVQTIISLK